MLSLLSACHAAVLSGPITSFIVAFLSSLHTSCSFTSLILLLASTTSLSTLQILSFYFHSHSVTSLKKFLSIFLRDISFGLFIPPPIFSICFHHFGSSTFLQYFPPSSFTFRFTLQRILKNFTFLSILYTFFSCSILLKLHFLSSFFYSLLN